MEPNRYPDIAYGPGVRERQAAVGADNRVEDRSAFALDPTDVALIRRADHFVLSTVTESGWPYAQHRGGPAGFVHALDQTTLAWAEFPGNRQYVTTGNLDAHDRVCMFFVDYPIRRRLKVFGHARLIEPEHDPELIGRLRTMGEKTYAGRVERALVVDVVAADVNCSKHITPRWDRAYIDELTGVYRRQIDELREE